MNLYNQIEEILNHPKLSDNYKFNYIKGLFKNIDLETLSDDELEVMLYVTFKTWRGTPRSSNVNKIMYDDNTKEMVLQFKDKSIYTYYNVDFKLFQNILNGNGECKTSGSNKYGSWEVGKSPSVGAAVYELLVETGVEYKRGGSLK